MRGCHTLREACGINFILADGSIQWEEFQLSTIFLKIKMDFFKKGLQRIGPSNSIMCYTY